MPIQILRQCIINHKCKDESTADFEARVSKLIDEEDYHVVAVLGNQEEGFVVEPVFILKQTLKPAITAAKTVDLAEVEGYVKDGWVVEALYAKTATIKKLAEEQTDYVDDVVALVTSGTETCLAGSN